MAASRRTWSSVLAVIAVAAILIGVNLIAETRLAGAQLDLTGQKLYTLSGGTRTILRGLKEPITLRLFYSRDLGSIVPVYGAYADRVREMLREYARLSNGRVKLEFFDPAPFSDSEDRALAYGLQGAPIDQSGEKVYFGIAGSNLLDQEHTIPFLQPERERFLEYDLTRLVYELSNPARPTIGVMSSLPLDGDPRMAMMMRNSSAGRPWASMLLLRQSDAVKPVPLDAQVIDPSIGVLLVAQAQNLSDATLYAIDQFVMRGGRLMVMVDPHSEAEAATPGATDTSSNLAKLFDAWGIAYDPTKVVGDLTGAWRVRTGNDDRTQAVDYIAWFNIRDGIARDDPATADLQQVTVASAGAIGKKPGANIEFTPLLTTDDRSGLIPVEKVAHEPDPARILAAFRPDGEKRVIAARLRGPLKSAFAGPPDPPKDADGKEEARPGDFPAYKAQTDGPANLVVAADSDILADRFWVRVGDFFGQQQEEPFSDNGAFVANLIGTLAGGDELIGLRSRGQSLRPFTRVASMQAEAEAQFRRSEQALQTHLDEVQKQLADLRGGGSNVQAVLTPEQNASIDKLRQDAIDTRGRLRTVQFNLKRDIDALETRVRLFDIVFIPAVLSLLAIGLAVVRRRRRIHARP